MTKNNVPWLQSSAENKEDCQRGRFSGPGRGLTTIHRTIRCRHEQKGQGVICWVISWACLKRTAGPPGNKHPQINWASFLKDLRPLRATGLADFFTYLLASLFFIMSWIQIILPCPYIHSDQHLFLLKTFNILTRRVSVLKFIKETKTTCQYYIKWRISSKQKQSQCACCHHYIQHGIQVLTTFWDRQETDTFTQKRIIKYCWEMILLHTCKTPEVRDDKELWNIRQIHETWCYSLY